MTGKEIIARVLARTGVTEEDFFGPRRVREVTAARVMAIHELTALGLSASAIGRVMRRNHATVLYWQKPEVREARKAISVARYIPRPKPEPKPKRKRVWKPKQKPADWTRHHCFYTVEEDAIAQSLMLRGASNEECLRVMGRNRNSVRKRVRFLNDPEHREIRRRYDRDRKIKSRAQLASVARQVPKGCEALFDHAFARAAAPRTLTATLLGDPPPGFSALDRRNASEARAR